MPTKNASGQSGFALVLALLALLLLTSLGLSLSTTTSTELQISTNHRWTESARYNAEAGIEYAKRLLASAALDWDSVLPAPRTGWGANAAPSATAEAVVNSRDFENYRCDSRGNGTGYGRVLTTGGTALQFATTVPGSTFALNGAFTVWVRRPVVWSETVSGLKGDLVNGQLEDYGGDDVLVLVAEGVAPYTGAANNQAFAITNRATYILESVVSKAGSAPPCEGRAGQTGGGAQGTNSWGCVKPNGIGSAINGIPDAGSGNAR